MISTELWVSPARPANIYSRTVGFKRMIKWGDWYVEPKIDGDRCLVVHSDGGIQFFSRHARPLACMVKRDHFRLLPMDSILDGEYVRKTGKLYIFDIPVYKGVINKEKIEGRREMCRGIVPELGSVRLIQRIEPGAGMLAKAKKDGHEGVVLKRKHSHYPVGETREWLKCKE